MLKKTSFVRAAAVTATAALALAGCSSAPAEDLTVSDPWVRSEAGDMTAMFAEVQNGTDTDLEIDRIETEVADTVEVHEMVESNNGSMVMREVEGGVTIPAGQTLVLEPGGEHFMFIGLDRELLAGETVTVVVHFVTGEQLTIEATVKDFTGGNEPYDDDSELGDDGDSDHGDSGNEGTGGEDAGHGDR